MSQDLSNDKRKQYLSFTRWFLRRAGSRESAMKPLRTWWSQHPLRRWWLDSRVCSLSTISRRNPWLWASTENLPTARSENFIHFISYSYVYITCVGTNNVFLFSEYWITWLRINCQMPLKKAIETWALRHLVKVLSTFFILFCNLYIHPKM